MDALGRLIDINPGTVPVDLNTAGSTGLRTNMRDCTGITFVVLLGAAASGTEDVTLDLQQHTAFSGGTTQDLDIVKQYWVKSEATLDGDETWTKVTQAAASEVTLAGATYAQVQTLVVIEVDAAKLSDGFTHVSLNLTDPGSVARLGAVLAIRHELSVQRAPELLAVSS